MTLPVAPGPKANYRDAGVPTQYVVHNAPFPTRYHGGIWKRPQTSPLPYVLSPQSVFKPDDFVPAAYARYPFSGTGALGMQYDTSRGVFGPTGRGGGIFATWATNGLGAEALQTGLREATGGYPWGTQSGNTATLQARINQALKTLGHCQIGVDGVLGKGTCAAWLLVNQKGQVVEPGAMGTSCREFGAPPGKPPCGGGGAPTPPTLPSGPGPEDAAAQAAMTGGGMDKRAIAAAVGGAAALVVVGLYAKKKGVF